MKQEFWDGVHDVWEGLGVTGMGTATAIPVPSPTASFLGISSTSCSQIPLSLGFTSKPMGLTHFPGSRIPHFPLEHC